MTAPKEAPLWRYEIKYGPEGEANYAWVYDADGNMVCTAKTYHAEAIVTRMNALASLQGEDAVERVKVLARRFWSIHPSTIAAMNLTREEFYAREMMALLATGIVPDEAAVRADNTANLISIIADIREKTGLGGKPMLNELADAIKDRISDLERQLAAETERCARVAQDNRQHSNQIVMRTLEAESAYEEACDDIAAAIRGGAK